MEEKNNDEALKGKKYSAHEDLDLKGNPVQESVVVEKRATETEAKPAKKSSGGCMKGCLIVFTILLFLLALMAGAVYIGYSRIVEAVQPVDLGVEYTQEDYNQIMQEIGFEGDATLLCIDCPTPSFTNPHEVEVTISNAQASAAFEYINESLTNASISGTQIKMNDGYAELSTVLTFQGNTFPVYMQGSISKATENSLDGEITSLKAGTLTVPNSVLSFVESFLLDTANDKLASAGDAVRIDSIEIKPEGLNFNGLIPTNAQ